MSGHKIIVRPENKMLLSPFKGTKEELIPILQRVQDQYGYLPQNVMLDIAKYVSIPESKVYATATFYSQFRFKPVGEKHICLCQGTACHVRGAAKIQDVIEHRLGITAGETTADGKYSLETVACIGCCGLAPCITINKDMVCGHLTPGKAASIFAEPSKEERKNAVKNVAG